MVRVLYCLFLLPFLLYGGNVDVKAEVSRTDLFEHYPVKGRVLITHEKGAVIDGFSYDGSPLEVQLERQVRIDPKAPLTISIYRFELPPQPAGRNLLGPIIVTVDDSEYSTPSVPYFVSKAEAPKVVEEPLLKLEFSVESEKPIFPGQRVKFIYRYIYRGNIQMTKEELPLLKPTGFSLIGEEIVRDYEEKDKNIREIVVEVEAVQPGTYTFPAALIEGNALLPGRPPLKLSSSIPSITLTVAPFPDKDKSEIFGGAFGDYKINAELLSPDRVKVGDRLKVAIDIFGSREALNKVELPNLFCQPGFPGMFAQDDLPVTGQIEGDHKRFVLYLRPLNDAVKSIPAIEFDYFSPSENEYKKSTSKPIPIVVEPVETLLFDVSEPVVAFQQRARLENWPSILRRVPTVDQEVVPIRDADLKNLSFGTWRVFWIFPFGIGFLVLQVFYKRWLKKRRSLSHFFTSQELLEKAKKHSSDEYLCHQLLTEAIFARLFEAGKIAHRTVPIEDVPESAERDFLLVIESNRYGSKKEFSTEDLLFRAVKIMGGS